MMYSGRYLPGTQPVCKVSWIEEEEDNWNLQIKDREG